MAFLLKKTVALVGMMGAGKTAVGTAVARELGVELLDSDAEIEVAADRTIAEIFERDGEPFFRDKEAQVIARLLVGKPSILSTGGGAYLAARNRDEIAAHGVAVWLRADVELLWTRVRHKNTRPLLRTDDPKATLTALCAAREPFYSQAQLHVQSDFGLTIDAMAERVIAALLTRPDVLVRR